MGSEMQARVAEAMRTRREELIAQPLARVWDELALAAMRAMREPTEGMLIAALPQTKREFTVEQRSLAIRAVLDLCPTGQEPSGLEGQMLDIAAQLASDFTAMLDAEIKKAEEG